VFLSIDGLNKTTLHAAADSGYFKVLEKMWEWAKELQLKPEKLSIEVFLSKDNYNRKPWHMAAEEDKVEVLEKMW
jgi:hypothetical protein